MKELADQARAIKNTYSNAINLFESLTPTPSSEKRAIIAICHLIGGTRTFIYGLSRVGRVALLLPKPKSIDKEELKAVQKFVRTEELNREKFLDPNYCKQLIEAHVEPDERLVILDIGGYFSPHADYLKSNLSCILEGIVEDTENGLQRYEKNPPKDTPVITVARSELKISEDFLVGQAVVFSSEVLMREYDSLMTARKATVIGYGKIGKSIANALHGKNLSTVIVETNPIRAIEAKAHGYHVFEKYEAISRGNIVFCATGQKSLKGKDFDRINNGSYIASVTSADDEFDFNYLKNNYAQERLTPHLERYSKRGTYFYLLNEGNAVNFVHKGRLGPFIYPVQAEILCAAEHLFKKENLKSGISELSQQQKLNIANHWQIEFASVNAP